MFGSAVTVKVRAYIASLMMRGAQVIAHPKSLADWLRWAARHITRVEAVAGRPPATWRGTNTRVSERHERVTLPATRDENREAA
jgi:hypothetical protein